MNQAQRLRVFVCCSWNFETTCLGSSQMLQTMTPYSHLRAMCNPSVISTYLHYIPRQTARDLSNNNHNHPPTLPSSPSPISSPPRFPLYPSQLLNLNYSFPKQPPHPLQHTILLRIIRVVLTRDLQHGWERFGVGVYGASYPLCDLYGGCGMSVRLGKVGWCVCCCLCSGSPSFHSFAASCPPLSPHTLSPRSSLLHPRTILSHLSSFQVTVEEKTRTC